MKNLLNALLAATVVVGTMATAAMAYAPFSLNDSQDTAVSSSYVAGRALEVSNPGQGTMDLTALKVVGPPTKFELTLNNPSAHPVNVEFAELGVNFLVPANSNRVVFLSPLEMGTHREVAYNVTQILEPRNTELSTQSIQYILDSSYVKTWQETPVAYQPQRAGNYEAAPANNETGTVRGFW